MKTRLHVEDPQDRSERAGAQSGRPPLALWHEVGRRTENDLTRTVYRTTPIELSHPVRGATDARITCRVCRVPVQVRVVDLATARRRRLWSTLLVPGQFLLALALVGSEVGTLASLGLRMGSGLPAVLAWLVVVLPVMLSVLGFAEWAQRRATGVTILGPPDARHTLGSGAAAVVTSRQHAPSTG